MNPLSFFSSLLLVIVLVLSTSQPTNCTPVVIQYTNDITELYEKPIPVIPNIAQIGLEPIATQQTVEFTPLIKSSDEEEEEKEAEEKAERDSRDGSVTLVLIILASIFALLIVILIIAVVTEAHSIVGAWIAAKREKDHVPTSSERFESELSSASGWHKMKPGERSVVV